MSDQINVISSEIAELEGILATMPQAEVIARISFESRLRAARAALAAAVHPPDVKKAKLTFRGKPVFGSHGIAAEFGTKAAGAFSDAFSAVVAGLSESLQYMGPIPDKAKNQLLITGTAIGSFGFELELPPQKNDLFPDAGRTNEALQKLQDLLRISAEGSDDEIAELVEEIHPRAVRKVADFLGYLIQNHALCGLEFEDKFFRFDSRKHLEVSAERLQEGNIRERDEDFIGSFAGMLPGGRTFEFDVADGSQTIKGKVAADIEDPDLINREWLKRPAKIKLGVIQVGKGRPRYTFKTWDALTAWPALGK
ncbi:hypothetical protein ASF61_22470 [Duganella sp. Leaf126]|uniref:hypothetical protein n=1 Tax=Duganella sp. Leaf126 TaxID=1736266 RepID=UPI0006F7BD9D|nr:hypothetical protein [Duganella sp. Leaf126]KQQ34057.1 hypothetical protein ASF61_22470 [Duganella sp. Leaf126]